MKRVALLLLPTKKSAQLHIAYMYPLSCCLGGGGESFSSKKCFEGIGGGRLGSGRLEGRDFTSTLEPRKVIAVNMISG